MIGACAKEFSNKISELDTLFRNFTMTPIISSPVALPIEQDVQLAKLGKRVLADCLTNQQKTYRIQILDDQNRTHQMELPNSTLRLIKNILSELATGNSVQLMPVYANLTQREAANLLNVSLPDLVALLENGEIPFYQDGNHRHIRFTDLLKYRETRYCASAQAMAELVKLTEELGLYHE
jgi:excisionase family DNA binding protein